jgi:hypothetical protein
MSGYFRRIASGVLHPQRAIHPVVGSLWIPQHNAVRSDQISETMAPIVPLHSTRPDAGQTRSALTRASVEQQSASARQDLSARTPDVSNPIEAKLEPEHPLLAVRDATIRQARDGPHADDLARPTAFTPLVATSSRASMLQPRGIVPASTLSRERTLPVTPSPASQPDEIEIHIGRIEVAAVLPQPAPRPPAPPVRKTLDLGEYLKRDRRSR